MVNLDNISLSIDKQPLLQNFSLQMNAGEIIGILGASGCGKTTFLRAIAGFHPIDQGQIIVNGKVLSRPNITLVPEKRRIGMVFQDYALFPHLTVADNIGFGLHKWSNSDKQARIKELLQLIQLENFENRFPHELSGGQQQRIALARALAPKPDLILLDEPFCNLDCELRTQLIQDTRQLLKAENTPAILVTHDLQDAETLCDRYLQFPTNTHTLHTQVA